MVNVKLVTEYNNLLWRLHLLRRLPVDTFLTSPNLGPDEHHHLWKNYNIGSKRFNLLQKEKLSQLIFSRPCIADYAIYVIIDIIECRTMTYVFLCLCPWISCGECRIDNQTTSSYIYLYQNKQSKEEETSTFYKSYSYLWFCMVTY